MGLNPKEVPGAAIRGVKSASVGAVRRTRSAGFGFGCTFRGFGKMMVTPKWWPYAITPVLIALIVFVLLAWWAASSAGGWAETLVAESFLAGWVGETGGFIAWLISLLMIIVVFAVIFWVAFPAFARVVSAPFMALLSDKVVEEIAGVRPPQPDGSRFVRWVVRPIFEAFVLLLIRLAVTILALPLNLVPVLGQAAFVAVLLPLEAMDLLDLAQSARAVKLGDRIPFIRHHLAAAFGLGGGAALFLFLPVVNVFVLPALVVGAVLLDKELSDDFPGPVPSPEEDPA